MLSKRTLLPAGFAAMGALGWLLRRAQLEAALDPVSGLYTPWHLMSVLLAVFTAAAAVIAAGAAIGARKGAGETAEAGVSWGFGHFVLGLLAAVLLALGAYMFHSGLWYSTFELPWLEKLCAMLAFLAAICIAVLSCSLSARKAGAVAKATGCVPPLFYCIWLLYYYRVNAIDPALQTYVWQCMGLAAAALGVFWHSGALYGVFKRGRSLWCLMMAEYLCILSMAGQESVEGILMLSATALWCAVLASSAVGAKPSAKNVE